MANHGIDPFVRTSPVDVTVSPSHRPGFLAQIGSQNIEEWLTERESASLVSNQRSKRVAWSQHHPNRRADRFLTFPQVAASSDFPGVPQGRHFVFDGSGQQHPFECTDVLLLEP